MSARPAYGETVEIKYRLASSPESFRDRWIRAQIIESDSDTWPLARLIDGQTTEVRPFMTWRRISAAGTI